MLGGMLDSGMVRRKASRSVQGCRVWPALSWYVPLNSTVGVRYVGVADRVGTARSLDTRGTAGMATDPCTLLGAAQRRYARSVA